MSVHGKMNVNIRIERLVLDGLPVTGNEGLLVQAAVEAELSRLVVEGGVSANLREGGALPYLPAGAISVTPGNSPGSLGRQIARSVYKGMGMEGVPGARGNHLPGSKRGEDNANKR